MWIIYVLIGVLWGVAWGITSYTIVVNKGYNEDWFWWGFFFHIFAALVALSKSDRHSRYDDQGLLYHAEKELHGKKILEQDGWRCICGRANPSYTGTCSCGKSIAKVDEGRIREAGEHTEVIKEQQITEEEKQSISALTAYHLRLDSIKKLKELMEMGILSEEEFNDKKTKVLEL